MQEALSFLVNEMQYHVPTIARGAHWQGYLVAIIRLKQVKISSVINFTRGQNQSMVKI